MRTKKTNFVFIYRHIVLYYTHLIIQTGHLLKEIDILMTDIFYTLFFSFLQSNQNFSHFTF